MRRMMTSVTTANVRICLLLALLLATCGPAVEPTEPPTEVVVAPSATATQVTITPTDTPIPPSPTPPILARPPYAPGSVPVIEQPSEFQAIPADEPFDIAISPDGSRAYVPAHNTDNLFVIDLDGNQIVHVVDLWPFADHPLGPAPSNVALTPDGRLLLVAADHDKSLLVIDTSSLDLVKRIPLGGVPTDILVPPEGDLAFVSVMAPEVLLNVIDLEQLVITRTLPPHPNLNGYYALALAPDQSRLYLAGVEGGGVAIIDKDGRSVQGIIQVPPVPGRSDLVIAPDGQTGYLSVMGSHQVVVLDLVNESIKETYDVEKPEGVALSADGKKLYVGANAGSGYCSVEYDLVALDTASGELIAGVKFKHPYAPYLRGADVVQMAFSQDGSKLYVPSIDAQGVFILNPETLDPLGFIPLLAFHRVGPVKAEISPDGAYLYVLGRVPDPAVVFVIDTATRQVVSKIVAPSTRRCSGRGAGLALSPDGHLLYVAAGEGCVFVVDTQSQTVVDHFLLNSERLTDLAVDPNGEKAYALDPSGRVLVIDLQTRKTVATLQVIEGGPTLKIAPDGKRAYVSGRSGFSIIDLTSDTVLKKVDLGMRGGLQDTDLAIGVTPDSSQYLVAGFCVLHIYDAATDEEIRIIDVHEWDGTWLCLIGDIVFHPDGSTGYLGMPDEQAIPAFDAKTWQVKAKIDVGRAPYYGVPPEWLVMSPDGSTLYAMAKWTDRVLIIDTATNGVIDVISLLE